MDDQTKTDQNDRQSGAAGEDAQDNETQLSALRERTLKTLLPVIDKVDEPPERKFEMLMTAARSSGDPGLLAKTLEAAQQITGDSQKANALLDVLNEINYHLRD